MTDDATNTRQWLNQLNRGDTRALADLFGYYRPRLQEMVRLRMGAQLTTRLDPSDVLQEVYVDATRRIQGYLDEPKVSPFVWLRGLVRDRLMSLQRRHLGAKRRSVHREVSLPEGSSLLLGQNLLQRGSSPSSALAKGELRRRVQGAIDALGPEDREVILMRHFEGLSNKEVAESLGLTDSGATMRHGRALARLKDLIERDTWLGEST